MIACIKKLKMIGKSIVTHVQKCKRVVVERGPNPTDQTFWNLATEVTFWDTSDLVTDSKWYACILYTIKISKLVIEYWLSYIRKFDEMLDFHVIFEYVIWLLRYLNVW